MAATIGAIFEQLGQCWLVNSSRRGLPVGALASGEPWSLGRVSRSQAVPEQDFPAPASKPRSLGNRNPIRPLAYSEPAATTRMASDIFGAVESSRWALPPRWLPVGCCDTFDKGC